MTPQTAQKNKQQVRDLDPNVRQRQAAQPEVSVWVNASAGSGKTKVLTDRILRLMLPGDDGRVGAPAHKILALTFTRAGAGEMILRLNRRLGEWAVMEEEKLHDSLKSLLGRAANADEIGAARKLFAQVVDTPGGLKIMTIHSFCQSILGRFPLEAGIAPHMNVMQESDSQRLFRAAIHDILAKARADRASPLYESLARISSLLNEERFEKLLQSIASERRQLRELLEKNFGLDGLYEATCSALGIPAGLDPEEIFASFCCDEGRDIAALRRTGKILTEHGTASYQEKGAALQLWLDSSTKERQDAFESYKSVFLTKDNELLKKLANKGALDFAPDLETILRTEAERILTLQEKINAASCALHTRDILRFGESVVFRYTQLKELQGALDYDDLIFRTLDLLQGKTMTPARENMSAWVLYKLDQGIDHILIDEAQDTNPEQWNIIRALTDELHAGLGAHDQTRTLFTVGDEKQSIYSFQRASPEEFSANHAELEQKFKNSGKTWDNVALNISFRSVKSVLDGIDSVFSDDSARKGLGDFPVKHESWRTAQEGAGGLVELWPLEETEKAPDYDPWQPPITIREKDSGAAKLATRIAQTISGWLENGEYLTARGRAVQPGDIMILVRTRGAFVERLSRTLKNAGVPVSGTDRLVLSNHIAVQDLVAFAEFALAPHDDLTLACILKSPLIGLSEDDLYGLAQGRGEKTLWTALRESAFTHVFDYLAAIVNAAHHAPFDFFTRLLQGACPADDVSGLRAFTRRLGRDAHDPIDEFLSAALEFEATDIAALHTFIRAQRSTRTEIKREQQEGGNEVRIMTVHGAKGLQAPIVILPDTVHTSLQQPGRAEDRMIWPDKSGLPVPLWSPLTDMNCALYNNAAAEVSQRLENEYRRLLYVAMTRAEDRLYVAGYSKKSSIKSWHDLVRAGLEKMPGVEQLPDGGLRIQNEQSRDVSPDKKGRTKNESQELPAWIFEPAPAEKMTVRNFSPSRAPADNEEQTPAYSPLQKSDPYRYRRGNIAHKLLEILPTVPPARQEEAARRFIARGANDLPQNIQDEIAAEIFAVLRHPDFAESFGTDSQAEVPVTGMVDGQLVTGRIDRLLIRPDRVYIIDYKTNRPPPKSETAIPAAYRRQLEAYAALLRQIYPRHKIRAALLWTHGPSLMPVTLKE